MKYFFQLIIIFAQLTLLGCSSLLKTADERAKVPLCKDNKANHNYSLTIYAYKEVRKGLFLDQASEQLEQLAAYYDWFAQGVMPRLLLRTEGFEKESNNNNRYAIENYYLSPRINHDVINELKSLGSNSSRDNIYSNLSFIPTSTKGDELVICPSSLCEGLTIPQINKTIEHHSRGEDRVGYGIYGVKENPYDEIGNIKNYNELTNYYFLYDILSKSGLNLGEELSKNYYVIPELEQKTFCKNVMKEIPTHPNIEAECFKYNDKDEPRIKEFKFGRRFGRHLSDETLQLAYMDSVARDYAEQSVFSFEKKNEGQWMIYKIKLNPEFICKYGRPMSEFKTK